MGVTFIAKEGTYTAPATLTTKSITENGTYSASDDNANGYSSVTVEVEGGGGSSDFSTAEVTVTDEHNIEIVVPIVVNSDGDKFSSTGIFGSGVFDVILYDGVCYGAIPDTQGETVAVSGDIELLEYNDIIITGNGTITIS